MSLLRTVLLTIFSSFLLSGTRPDAVFTCPFQQGIMILKPMDFEPWMNSCFPDYSVTVQGTDSCIYGVEGARVASAFSIGSQQAIILQLGDLFFTYCSVDSVIVRKNMLLTNGQVIGYAGNHQVDLLISKRNMHDIRHPENMLDCSCTTYPPGGPDLNR